MGGCVISLLNKKHEGSLISHCDIEKYQAYGPGSRAVSQTETSTSSNIYRNGRHFSDEEMNAFRDKAYYGLNLSQQFSALCEERSSEVAIGYRKVEKVVNEEVELPGGEKKLLEVTYLKPRQSMTYGEIWAYTKDFSRGLGTLGLSPRSSVAIYEETRWEWLVSAYGIWLQDFITVTVYANLGEDALAYAMNEIECKVIICNGKNAPNLLCNIAAGKTPPCIIIYMDELPEGRCEAVEGCRMLAWQEVVDMGRKSTMCDVYLPKDNDQVALIMYTSGTTGDPKGVVHSHGSIAAGVKIMDHWLFSLIDLTPDVTYCAYLPLAHILEFGVVNIFLARGALVGFGSPRTLTDLSARPHGDLHEYRPTALIGVPRIFDTLKKAIEAKLPPPGSFKRKIFDHAYKSRLQALREGKETPYWNKKVFSQARAALGGRLRCILSGGGPLGESTQEFVNVVLNLMVIGWGLTESVCVGAIQRLGDLELGVTGQVLIGEEVKLLDTEEYKHTDTPEPRGEICLRGPFLFKGYYKQPELTKEVLDEDGWFHTGDVGSFTATGKLRIIGRVKALAKNVLGEYIALEALEAMYSSHILVLNNCICVLVDPYKNYICALAVVDASKIGTFAKEHGIPYSSQRDFPAILETKEFQKAITASMAKIAQQRKRKRFEYLRRVCFVQDVWTPENGMLTAAMKLRRNPIATKYEQKIKEMFSED